MRLFFKAIFVTIFLLTCVSTLFCQENIVVAVGEYVPLTSESLKHNGAVPRIITEAFALEGATVKFVWVPWKRAYEGVKQGTYDLSPSWSKSSIREAEVIFSDPLYKMYHVFFHLKSRPFKWTSFNDLKGLRVGATIGYFYGDSFANSIKENIFTVEYAPSDNINFKKLARNRLAIFPANVLTGYHLAKKSLTPQEFSLLTNDPKPLAPPSYHFAVATKNQKGAHIMQLFNRGLEKLKKSGKFDQYLNESKSGEYDK